MLQSEKYLHKISPYCVFWDESALLGCLLNDAREVTAATVFHENIEDSSISIYIAVVIADDIFVVEIFENVSVGRKLGYGLKW